MGIGKTKKMIAKSPRAFYTVGIIDNHNQDEILLTFENDKQKMSVSMDKSTALLFSNTVLKEVIMIQFKAEAKKQKEKKR